VVPLAAAAAEADVVAEVAAVAAVVEAAVLPSNGLIFSACAFRDRRGKGGCKRRDTGVLLFVEPTLRGSPLASQRVLPRTWAWYSKADVNKPASWNSKLTSQIACEMRLPASYHASVTVTGQW
jgi:hypothetical protein